MRNSNRVGLFVLAVVGCVLLGGCTQHSTSDGLKKNELIYSDITEVSIVAEEPYYLIAEKNGLYSYKIYDKDKNVVRTKEKLTKQPQIVMVGEHTISVTQQAGTGIATSSTYYYDVESNQFSNVFQAVFDQREGLVVYAADHNRIVIRDIFEENGYYQEIFEFQKPLSPAAFPFVDVKFSRDGSTVCVTYLSGNEYMEISESFEIG